MNKLQTQPAPAGVYRTSSAVRVVLVAAAAIVTVVGAMRMIERPPFVDHVSVANGSSLQLDVDVSGKPSDEWTPVGAVLPGATATFREVIDHGDRWWVRVTAGGHTAVWQVPSTQLDEGSHRIVVPRAVIDELVAARSSVT